MAQKTFQFLPLLAGIGLTLLALVAQRHFPPRTLTLVPAITAEDYFLMGVANDPEQRKVGWIDKKKIHFFCRFAPEDEAPICNFVFVLRKPGGNAGINLNQYQSLDLDIAYRGPADGMGVSIRNFDPRFSRIEDGNSSKINSVHLRASELRDPLRISLAELSVPEWWVRQYDWPREYIRPDRGNATALSIDLTGELRGTEHEIEIRKIEFSGDWIGAEYWYLGIICLWMLFGTAWVMQQLLRLRRRHLENRRRISVLASRNSMLQSEKERLHELSTIDTLTNVANRHGIELILESMKLQLEPASVIIIDVDHFKVVNDLRGHDAGDRVLQTIARVLRESLRNTDRLGRWGGEEFVLICPGATVHGAVELAEQLRTAISDTTFEPRNPLKVTASFGVAALRRNEPFAQAFKRADDALYHAKHQGRDRVVVAPEDLPFPENGAGKSGR